MALDKLVDSSQLDADLTTIANAIRTKGGTSAQIAFPTGFVSAIESIDTEDKIPNYWMQHLQAKIDTVNTRRSMIVNPFSTVFLTDVHFEDNNMHSPALIRELMLRTGVNSAVCGGDLIVRQDTKAAAAALIADWVKRTRGLQMVQLCGNHDLNSEPSLSGAGLMSYAEWFELVSDSADNVVWYTHSNGDVTGFGYRLHPAEKICELFLNTGANSAAGDEYHFSSGLSWAYDYIKTLDSTWGVIIYAHKFWQPTGHMVTQNPAQYIQSYLAARKNAIEAEIIALITGHCHDDYYDYDSEDGYLILSTTCDAGTAQAALDEVNKTRTPGTTLEQAFDVITIDRTNKILYADRIGAGSSRVLPYYHKDTYSVNGTYTNVTNSNAAESVDSGESYNATLTVAQGCAMKTILITMGGVDVTASVYSSGTIGIPSVSGDIVITAIAEASKPTWTNLVPSALATNGSVYNTTGYKDGKYLSNTTATFEGGNDASVTLTGRIPYSKADFDAGKVLCFSGLDWTPDDHCRMAFCSSLTSATSNPYCKGSATATGNASNIRTYFELTQHGDYWTLTPIPGATSASFVYMACSLKGSGADLSIGVIDS